MSVKTKLFLSNKTQAVRLPKEVAFDDSVSEVEILAVGESRVIIPAGRKWDWFFTRMVELGADYPAREPQPEPQEREWWY